LRIPRLTGLIVLLGPRLILWSGLIIALRRRLVTPLRRIIARLGLLISPLRLRLVARRSFGTAVPRFLLPL
jgi:hypothetical protein